MTQDVIDQSAALTAHADAIRRLDKQATKGAAEIGEHLTGAKTIVRKMGGSWGDWLKVEFEWSESTALRYMRVYEWAKSKNVNLTSLDLPRLSVLHLLLEPGTSDEARAEINERVKRGEKVKHKDVAAVTRKSKRPRPSKSNGLRAEIEAAVKAAGDRGMTSDELKVKFGKPNGGEHNEQTVGTTTNNLKQAGVLYDNGARRRGRADGGRKAEVYVWVAEADRAPLKKSKKSPPAKPAPSADVIPFADRKADADIGRMIEDGSLVDALKRWAKTKSRIDRIYHCYQLVKAILPGEDSLSELNIYRLALRHEEGNPALSMTLGSDTSPLKPVPLSSLQQELLQKGKRK